MKRITIRRKKSKPAPQPEPEPEPEEEETSEYSSEETVAESEPPTQPAQPVRNLKTRERPKQRQQVQFQDPVHEPRSARVERQQYFPQEPRRVQPYHTRKPAPQLGQPRSMIYPKPSRQPSGRQNLRYKSIYGPNSRAMTTQEKARQLYFSCFG